MDYLEKARRVIRMEIDELKRLEDRVGEEFTRAIGALVETIAAGKKIIIVGVGKSGNIGNKIAATLNSTGATTTTLNCQDALHGDLGLIDKGDAVLALSYSGETRELLDILPHVRRQPVTLIAMTGKEGSTLARESDIFLNVNVEREACPLNLAPTSSTTAMLVLGDALAMVLLEARGFKREDFAQLHPGGSLGHALLTRARDIMRVGDALATVGPDATVRDALDAMTVARTGAVLVVADDGILAGIFTQGDFARAFQSGDLGAGDRPVSELMTASPISIDADKLAAEVLSLLESHPIDDLPVIESATGKVVGLIDTQDLTRLRIL